MMLQLPRQRALWRYHRNVKPIVMLMAAAAVIPNLDQLEQMSARFAPVQLKYDEAGLSAGDRKALPKLVEAARVLNFVFMDQLWSGDRALYEKLQKDTTPLGKQRLHYFWLNKGPWSDLDGHTAFLPGVPERKPLGANFYPGRHEQGGVRGVGEGALEGAARTGRGLLLGHSPQRQAAHRRPLQPGVCRRSEEGRRSAARGRRADRQRFAEKVPDAARRRLSVQRLLCKRRRLDGSRCAARYHDRAVRDLQRRAVRVQGRLRGLHHDPRRQGDRSPEELRLAPAGDREQSADRSAVPESQARRVGARSAS